MRRPQLLFLLFLFPITETVIAQQIAFQKYYPPVTWSCVFAEQDGSCEMIGMTVLSSAGGPSDVSFIKLDSSGNVLFRKKLNANTFDDPQYVRRYGSGFLIAGEYATSSNNYFEPYLLQIDSNGSVVRSKGFGSIAHGGEGAIYVVPMADSGFALLSWTYNIGAGLSDLYLLRIDSSFNVLWGKSYGGPDHDAAWYAQVIPTSDNGFLMATRTMSFNSRNCDMLIIKTDSTGDPLWEKVVGDTGYEDSRFIYENDDGTYTVLGNCTSFDWWNGNILATRIDLSGNIISTKTIGIGSGIERAEIDTRNRLLIAGSHSRRPAVFELNKDLDSGSVVIYDSLLYLFNADRAPDGGLFVVAHAYDGPYNYFPATHLVRTDPQFRSGCNERDTTLIIQPGTLRDSIVQVLVDTAATSFPVDFVAYPITYSKYDICGCEVHAAFTDSISDHDGYFFDTSTGASAYYWDFGNGSHSHYQDPSVHYWNPGSYTVTLVVTDGVCSDTIQQVVTIAAPPVDPELYFDLQPTLSSGNIELKYYLPAYGGAVFRIFDLLGQELYIHSLTAGIDQDEIVDISSLSQSAYICRIEGEHEVYLEKKIILIHE